VLYRRYTPKDFDQLYALEEACYQPPLRFGRGYMHQLVSSSDSATWVAEEDGRMAGFGLVEWAEETEGVIAYIQTLEVAPDKRGQGVGGELLRLIEGSARAAGAQLIWLHVDAENASAIRLYEAHGYLCEGEKANYYARSRDALIYAKKLGTKMGS
jgi:ribosomal-protein-alanine N-acetyltransferase